MEQLGKDFDRLVSTELNSSDCSKKRGSDGLLNKKAAPRGGPSPLGFPLAQYIRWRCADHGGGPSRHSRFANRNALRLGPALVQRTVNRLDLTMAYAIGPVAAYWLIERRLPLFLYEVRKNRSAPLCYRYRSRVRPATSAIGTKPKRTARS